MRFIGLLLTVAMAWSTPSLSAPRNEQPAAARCAAMASFTWPSLVLQTVESVPAGPLVTDGKAAGPVLPAHCMIRGVIGPRAGAQGQSLGIGFELRLPIAWNGRFVFEGGGGLDGVLHPALGTLWGEDASPALSRGFAVISTDGGHRSNNMADAHFALDQQARRDYADNALDKATLLAKAAIERFYGRPAQYSYFIGCSNGGRNAMIAAERFPLYFDGIVAGDPTFRLAETNIAQAWNEIALARIAPKDAAGRPILSRSFSDSDLTLVAQAVRKECDANDGLADGMINDFKACRFDPAKLICTGAKTDQCLTKAQVATLKDLFDGPHDSQGRALYAAFPYDTGVGGPAFRHMHLGTSPTADTNSGDATIGFASLRYFAMTPPDPDFDPMKFDFDLDPARVRETAREIDADATYLTTFAGHGKLILYHGLSDQGLSPLDTLNWYNSLNGGAKHPVHQWARLFLVPGMTHCGGGSATDQFDMLAAIQAWVEKGAAPDRIVATGKAFPGVSRPLCPSPLVARYTGGDPSSEKSFACRP